MIHLPPARTRLAAPAFLLLLGVAALCAGAGAAAAQGAQVSARASVPEVASVLEESAVRLGTAGSEQTTLVTLRVSSNARWRLVARSAALASPRLRWRLADGPAGTADFRSLDAAETVLASGGPGGSIPLRIELRLPAGASLPQGASSVLRYTLVPH